MLTFSHLERRGIELGETNVLVEACPIRGKRFGILSISTLHDQYEKQYCLLSTIAWFASSSNILTCPLSKLCTKCLWPTLADIPVSLLHLFVHLSL